MTINFKAGDIIRVKEFESQSLGKVIEVKGKKVFALMNKTTTGSICEFSLRNDNTFVRVGWSKDDSDWGGWFRNGDSPFWK